MKLHISNLGVIDSFEINLSKPFILFTGKNGSGKTYASSFIYSLLWEMGIYIFEESRSKRFSLPVSQKFKYGTKGVLNTDAIYDFIDTFLHKYKKEILSFMNLDVSAENFLCSIVSSKEEWRNEVFLASFSEKDRHGIQKKSGSLEYRFYNNDDDTPFWYTSLVLSLVFGGVKWGHFFPAERNGIYTFSRELSVGRLRFSDKVNSFSYPRPIADSLANSEKLASSKRYFSSLSYLADSIEDEIIKGELSVSDDGEVSYDSKGLHLGINDVSSSIKAVAPFVLYLRHLAAKDKLLFIDEPELNLHPDNQILLARQFSKMINAGQRLLISTHSDYIIREINNMIMASHVNETDSGFVSKLGYAESSIINKDKLVVYYFESGVDGRVKVRELPVDNRGFNMPSIDHVIEKQNDIMNSLYDYIVDKKVGSL